MSYDFILILSTLMIIYGIAMLFYMFLICGKGTWKIILAYGIFLLGGILLVFATSTDIFPKDNLKECGVIVESLFSKRNCSVICIDTVHYTVETRGDTLYLFQHKE